MDFFEGVISFFNLIGNWLSTAFDFVINFLTDLGNMLIMAWQVVSYVPTLFNNFFPAQVMSILLVAVGVTILYRILARD